MNTNIQQVKNLIPAGRRQKIIDEAKTLLCNAAENVLKFSKTYASTIIEDATMRDDYAMAFPHLDRTAWKKIEAIGCGKILPELFYTPASSAIERLPIDEQERVLGGTIEMLTVNGETTDVLRVEYKNLSVDQRCQVIDYDHIRSLEEQRVYIEKLRTAKYIKAGQIKKCNYPYIVNKGKLTVSSPCEITKEELWRLLQKM